MTAPIASSANLMNGIREFGDSTLTYGGYFQSDGSAYNLTLPFYPDKFEWYNYTKFGTNSNNLQGVWFRDFPAGDALIVTRGTTDLSSTLETTNGITDASTAGGFQGEHLVITGIAAGVVTYTPATGITLANGGRVVLTKIIGTVAAQLNNNTYVIGSVTSTTFKLYDVYGVAITQVGTYTSSGQATLTGPSLGIVNAPPSYILTLGTSIVSNDNDVIYFVATKFNNYINVGDTA
jgi:hypothetical protein